MYRPDFFVALVILVTASSTEADNAGSCPVLSSDAVGACAEMCAYDFNCTGNQKCCFNGCGHSCMDAEPYVLCAMYCPYGFVLDDSGRPTCNCSRQTEIHDGECPDSAESQTGVCSEMCYHDGNCSSAQKCCSNGCGHVCIDAVFPEKDGDCPVTDDETTGVCIEECSNDMRCSGSMKCCVNGCGRSCMEPVNSTQTYRPGTCPVGLLPEGSMGACADICRDDFECPTHQKCCSNGCGHVCMMAETLPVVHEGSCPAISVPQSQFGLCVEDCDNDGDCETGQKCCSNGCGHLCMRTADEPAPCPEVICLMWCPYGYRQDSNGCNMCECNPQTEIHEGECPTVPSDVNSICMTSCQHDGNCSSNQKCCLNGCGQACVDAIIPADDMKAGSCPINFLSEGVGGICSTLCTSDRDCPGSYKCCSNGCGNMCMEALDLPVHDGTCPVGLLPEGNSGICLEACAHDGECGPYQKCCSNGCGQACITVADVPDGCPDVLCQMFCEFGLERDENGCEMCICQGPNGECPVGLLPEGVSGICSEECATDGECMPSQKCCSNGCGHVCLDVASGDSTTVCPDMMCLIWCEYGYQQDQNGCNACLCNKQPVTCPEIMCMIYCPYGNRVDENRCVICMCNDAPATCLELMCTMYCSDGYKRDEQGCEVCACSEPPVIHPGTCPVNFLPESMLGTCVNLCDNDNECSSYQKCCTNGCGYSCVDALDVLPVCPEVMCMRFCPHGFKQDRNGCDVCDCNAQTVIHAGDCPVLDDDARGTCVEACQHDGNCTTNQKCCSNGCGHSCVEAVQSGVIKSGTCPTLADDVMGLCAEQCAIDAVCPGGQKCCSNGCGHSCMNPILPVIRPGTCPTGLLPESASGTCSEACRHDGECSTNQKCCSNGCGHSCVTVINEHVTCPEVMCMIFCAYGFQRGEDGCDICVCNEPPVEKPGSCPVSLIPDGGVGTCVDVCYVDSDCSVNQKCCSNGCGHVCMTAVDVPVVHLGTCPVGLIPDGLSGACAEMCALDRDCAPNQKCCSNGCGHTCLDVAPDCSDRVMCAMFCELGYVKDSDGCDICQCLEPVICSPVMCNMWCELGFESDNDGCDICQCRVQLKLGSCPSVDSDVIGICDHSCSSDSDCINDQKCCSNGCGMVCVDPVLPSKLGTCPVPTTDMVGICVNECDNDHDCTTNNKCCYNGCGKICTAPESIFKPGQCPAVSSDTSGLCVEDCVDDSGCPSNFKCCENGCGHICVSPLRAQGPKPGSAACLIVSPVLILLQVILAVLSVAWHY